MEHLTNRGSVTGHRLPVTGDRDPIRKEPRDDFSNDVARGIHIDCAGRLHVLFKRNSSDR